MRIAYEKVGKRFGGRRKTVVAVRDFSLEIADGELVVLLGPSGCGKSTLLNLTAGLERPSEGRILFDGRPVAAPAEGVFVPPRRRDVAMVFQSYALYPHLDVRGNIAFPLRIAGGKGHAVEAAVARAADRLGIADLLDRRIGQLSGGQRQRVAIARALVRRPAVFLLDEPLSNLDAQLRTSTRAELKRLQRELGITTIHVTHDQVEAMTLGDRIVLLRAGAVVQLGTPADLYERPASPFAATFVGSPPMNLLRGRWRGTDGGPRVELAGAAFPVPPAAVERLPGPEILVGIRPEQVTVAPGGQGGGRTVAGADGAPGGGPDGGRHGAGGAGGGRRTAVELPGHVTVVEPLGREVLYHVDVGGGEVVAMTRRREFEPGQAVRLRFAPDRAHLFARPEPGSPQASAVPLPKESP